MPITYHQNIQTVLQFLQVRTPEAWLKTAITQLPTLLIDHAHSERKAAGTALNFINKYAKEAPLVRMMSQLAREELLHFEKVLDLLKTKNIPFAPLKLSYYAKRLHQEIIKSSYPMHLSDSLIVGAIIEARSCERFYALIPYLEKEPEMATFYRSLVKSEARHFEDYLHMAQYYRKESIQPRVDELLQIEREWIESPDPLFRFHSGVPITCIEETA